MDKNKSFTTEIRELIKKIKNQDLLFGAYLEDSIIFNQESDSVVYLGVEADQIPHLPIVLEE